LRASPGNSAPSNPLSLLEAGYCKIVEDDLNEINAMLERCRAQIVDWKERQFDAVTTLADTDLFINRREGKKLVRVAGSISIPTLSPPIRRPIPGQDETSQVSLSLRGRVVSFQT